LLEGVGGTGAYKADLICFAREGLPKDSGKAVRTLAGKPKEGEGGVRGSKGFNCCCAK
jgi:hypothetical protein